MDYGKYRANAGGEGEDSTSDHLDEMLITSCSIPVFCINGLSFKNIMYDIDD